MGLVWDVLKDITKTVINVHSLGAFDVKVAGETEDGSSGSSGIRRSDTVSKISPADSSLGDSLVDACLQRDVPKVLQLLNDGADPNHIKNSVFGRENSLHYAWGRRDLLLILLKCGADPNIRLEVNRGLPLEVACAEGDYETACILLEHGASVSTKDNDGWTPLMLAVGNTPNVALVKELLSRGSDPNACDNEGWSVLMNASRSGDFEAVELLLRAGAKCDIIDNCGGSR